MINQSRECAWGGGGGVGWMSEPLKTILKEGQIDRRVMMGLIWRRLSRIVVNQGNGRQPVLMAIICSMDCWQYFIQSFMCFWDLVTFDRKSIHPGSDVLLLFFIWCILKGQGSTYTCWVLRTANLGFWVRRQSYSIWEPRFEIAKWCKYLSIFVNKIIFKMDSKSACEIIEKENSNTKFQKKIKQQKRPKNK